MAAALERLLKDFPKSDVAPSAHFLLGEHLYELKRYPEAAVHYAACAEAVGRANLHADDFAKALYTLAWSHYQAEKFVEAAAAFDQLIEKAPDSPFTAEAQYLVGLIRQREDKHAEALARFAKALDAKPAPKYEERSLVQAGQSQQALAKWGDALKSYQRALEKFPDSELKLDATYGLGLASQHLGAYADAEDAFRKVVAATKTELAARAQYGLGECAFLQGNTKEALKQLLAVEITYAYEKWRAASLLKVMECHAKLGNPERVRYYYKELSEKFPKADSLSDARKLVDALDAPKPKE
jgi:TolA-binding protein